MVCFMHWTQCTVKKAFSALYRGRLPSLIGAVPYVGLNFAVYDSLKNWLLWTNAFGLAKYNEFQIVTRLGFGAVAVTIGKTGVPSLMLSGEECRWLAGTWNHAASVVHWRRQRGIQEECRWSAGITLLLLLLEKAKRHSSTMV